MSDLLVARYNAWVEHNDGPYLVERGKTLAHPDHPVAKRHPELFEPVTVHLDVTDAEPEPDSEPEPDAADPQPEPPRRGRPRKAAS